MKNDDSDIKKRIAAALRASPFLNTARAAFYLGLSRSLLEKKRKPNGNGPKFSRHFGQIRYHIDDLDAWSKAHVETPQPDNTSGAA